MKHKLSDEQVARKRKDKHAKHEAESKLDKRERKHGHLNDDLWVDNTWTDLDEQS